MVWAYSVDLRERVLKYLEKNKDKNTASQLFEVGIATVYRWVKQKREKGHLQPKNRKYVYRKLDYDLLKKHVEEYPDQFLFEIASQFAVTEQAIFYALKKLKITRKKRLRFTRNAMKRKERSLLKS